MAKRQRERMSISEMVKVSKGGKRPAPRAKAPAKKKETRAEEMDRGVLGSASRLGKILMSGHETAEDERN